MCPGAQHELLDVFGEERSPNKIGERVYPMGYTGARTQDEFGEKDACGIPAHARRMYSAQRELTPEQNGRERA